MTIKIDFNTNMFHVSHGGEIQWCNIECPICGKYCSDSFLFEAKEGITKYKAACRECKEEIEVKMEPELVAEMLKAQKEREEYYKNIFPAREKRKKELEKRKVAVIEVEMETLRSWEGEGERWSVGYMLAEQGCGSPCDKEEVDEEIERQKRELQEIGFNVVVWDCRPKIVIEEKIEWVIKPTKQICLEI